MSLKLRPGTKEDAAVCGVIIFEAFKSIADQHNFPPDIPSVQEGTRAATMLLSNRFTRSWRSWTGGPWAATSWMNAPGLPESGRFQLTRRFKTVVSVRS